jgi:hypothetical protein
MSWVFEDESLEITLADHIENIEGILASQKDIHDIIKSGDENEAFKRILRGVDKWKPLVVSAMKEVGIWDASISLEESDYLSPKNLKSLLERLEKQKLYNKFGI